MLPSVRQVCEQRFVSALKDLSSSKGMKSFELHCIVQRAKVMTLSVYIKLFQAQVMLLDDSIKLKEEMVI